MQVLKQHVPHPNRRGDLTDTEYAPEYLNLVVEATPFTMTRQLQDGLKEDFYDLMQNIRVEAVKLPNRLYSKFSHF